MKKPRTFTVNYWPGFSDLLISVVLMLILYLFVQEITFYLSDAYKQEQMKKRQETYKERIKLALGPDSTAIDTIFANGVNQTISFRSSLLFDEGKARFRNKKSEQLIRKIGRVFQEATDSSYVLQIVVEGHTNSKRFRGQYGNWSLASDRAVTVIKLLLEMGVGAFSNGSARQPSRMLSIAGFADRDYVLTEAGKEDMEESKRIQFSLIYDLDVEEKKRQIEKMTGKE